MLKRAGTKWPQSVQARLQVRNLGRCCFQVLLQVRHLLAGGRRQCSTTLLSRPSQRRLQLRAPLLQRGARGQQSSAPLTLPSTSGRGD